MFLFPRDAGYFHKSAVKVFPCRSLAQPLTLPLVFYYFSLPYVRLYFIVIDAFTAPGEGEVPAVNMYASK